MINYILKSPHRNLLEEKLMPFAAKIHGKILDAGSKNNPYASLFSGEVIAIDLKPVSKTVVEGDITNLSFAENTFDGVLSTEVLEYVKEPKKAVTEIHRVLKKGGIALVSAPLMYKVHQDLVRYTKDHLKELFADFEKVEIFPIGNFYTIILDILRDKIISLKPAFLRYIIYIPYLFLVIFIKPSQFLIKDQNFVSGYLVLAKK